MKRNKYLNTFDNTADYENYIESAYPGFPNVGLTKDNGELHYMRTSPNAHVWYGEVVDPAQALPTISLDNQENTPTLDELNNAFYLDSWSNAAPTSISFGNKSNLKSIKKLKGLDTSNVTTMNYMFNSSSSLTSLDLSSFNTSNVTDMYYMFYGCSSLTSLDLSNFDTSKVTSMGSMFQNCSSLTSLDLSNWNIKKISSGSTKMTQMFYFCTNLSDVYINKQNTLNTLTNGLTMAGGPSNNFLYITDTAIIHYTDEADPSTVIDYYWDGSAWTQL